MPRRRALTVAIAVGIVLLLGLPTALVALGPAVPPATAGARSGMVRVAPAYVPGSGVRSLGPLPSDTRLQVVAALAPRDLAGMEAELALTTTPGSPEYGHYLTAAQITNDFGPSDADYGRAVAYFAQWGLTVATSPDRWAVAVSGPASSVGAAFGTEFDEYTGPSGTFFEHPTAASLPASLPWSGVLGLGSDAGMRPLLPPLGATGASPKPAASCSGSTPFAPCAIDDAYNVSSLLTAGDNGTGYTIGVVDVYDGSEAQPQLASDLQGFTSTFGIPLGSVHYLYPVPTSNNLNNTNTGWGSEEALDLEWTRAMAPGATLDMTFAPDPTAGLYSSVDWLVAHQAVNVISLSWGEPDVGEYNAFAGACPSACNASSDGSYTILHPVMVAAALEGIGVFAASGDCGAAFGTNGVSTSYPASDPAVTGVGATDLGLTGTTYSTERGWSGNDTGKSSPGCQNQGGSGGGYSPFPRPAWQDAPGFPSSGTVRGVPDISIVGGSPVAVVISGFETGVEGTSVSCPVWAGLAAIADQVHGSPLGFLAPSLYAAARSSNAAKYFHDVKSGSNGYAAGKGWDPVTGIGSPIASALLPALGGGVGTPTSLFAEVVASPRSGAVPLTVSFSSLTFNATAPLYGFDVDFGDGNATWSTNGSATHTYRSDGVYLARSVAFQTDGNSSVSPPIAIVVGGGSLAVTLNASTTAPSAGAPVTLNSTVVGGTGPYRYSYSFGDGTYLSNSRLASVVHAYPIDGTYCAVVVASDAGAPPSGGASPRVPIVVGGGTSTSCHPASPVSASISASRTLADLPGDIAFHVTASGGLPPYSVRLVSDDPYVNACSCGIFSTPGNHTVTAFVNDSQSGSTQVSMNVTLFPAIDAAFVAAPSAGTGVLIVNFTAAATGGDNVNASLTNWTFGDGPTNASTGAGVSHTYATPGFYVANARLTDAAGWNATGVFLVDVRPASAPTALAVAASVFPGANSPSGAPLTFTASASGGAAPYAYQWGLGPNASATGPVAHESYANGFCPNAPTCVLDVYLNVTDAAGTTVRAVIPIAPAVGLPGTALVLTESVGPTSGVTPLDLSGVATAVGMPSVNLTWSYGTGSPSYGPSASYQYLTPANYTLTVTATDPLGDRIVHSHEISVSGVARTLPSVHGGPGLTVGVVPFADDFIAVAAGGAGPPYAYTWTFGDGTSALGGTTNHTYTSPGNFTATLTVTDAIGTPVTMNWLIVVYNVTAVVITATAPTALLPPGSNYSVTFQALPLCTKLSLPLCPERLTQLSVSDVGTGFGALVDLNASWDGQLNTTAPTVPGNYSYDVAPFGFSAYGAYYNGSTLYTIHVGGNATVITPPSRTDPTTLYLELLGVGLAVLVVAVLVVVSRRRTPAPPTP